MRTQSDSRHIVFDADYKGATFYPTGYAYLYAKTGKTINEFIDQKEKRIFINTEFTELLED